MFRQTTAWCRGAAVVNWENKFFGAEGELVPQCPIAGDADARKLPKIIGGLSLTLTRCSAFSQIYVVQCSSTILRSPDDDHTVLTYLRIRASIPIH